jgi:uncharacterized protein YvpB
MYKGVTLIVKEPTIVAFLSLLGSTVIMMCYLFLVLKEEGGFSEAWDKVMGNNGTDIVVATAREKESDTIIVKIKDRVLLDAPIIKQFPELPRGCEVTSLAMLLQYEGIEVGKMELAEMITKNPTPLRNENGRIFWGHPNDGYIGNMYSYDKPGYGVYHKPIKQLAERFLPGRVIDLTGREFEELKTFLSMDIPVWVITNTTYRKLPESSFEKWQTPRGEVKITYKEHSVLITGYDDKYIYFNDPLSGVKNKKIQEGDFIEAWTQMGRQAITYLTQDFNKIDL